MTSIDLLKSPDFVRPYVLLEITATAAGVIALLDEAAVLIALATKEARFAAMAIVAAGALAPIMALALVVAAARALGYTGCCCRPCACICAF